MAIKRLAPEEWYHELIHDIYSTTVPQRLRGVTFGKCAEIPILMRFIHHFEKNDPRISSIPHPYFDYGNRIATPKFRNTVKLAENNFKYTFFYTAIYGKDDKGKTRPLTCTKDYQACERCKHVQKYVIKNTFDLNDDKDIKRFGVRLLADLTFKNALEYLLK